MKRAGVAAFVVAALVVGYGAAAAVDGLLRIEAIFAGLAVALVVALFGWCSRGRDIVEVVATSLVVAYAGYLGLALARASNLPHVSMEGWFPVAPTSIASLGLQWPVILLAGIPFALVLVILLAVPFSLIPVRRAVNSHANDALWRFVEEHVARAEAPPPRAE